MCLCIQPTIFLCVCVVYTMFTHPIEEIKRVESFYRYTFREVSETNFIFSFCSFSIRHISLLTYSTSNHSHIQKKLSTISITKCCELKVLITSNRYIPQWSRYNCSHQLQVYKKYFFHYRILQVQIVSCYTLGSMQKHVFGH